MTFDSKGEHIKEQKFNSVVTKQLTPCNQVPHEKLSSTSEEIPHLLWNHKIYYRVHNSSSLERILTCPYVLKDQES